MRIRCIPVILLVVPLAAAACGEAPSHLSRLAVPVKSACPATARTPASVGVDVRAGRRHSEARTIFVTNLGDADKRVELEQVTRAEGACSADWSGVTPLSAVDAATCKPPEPTTLPPGRWQEFQIDDQRVSGTWECTKLGIALWLRVDGESVCADAGAWIAAGPAARSP